MPRSRRRWSSELALVLVAALGFVVAGPRGARADDEAVAAYQRAVERGAELFGDEDYTGAREAFEIAYAIHPEPTLVFNIASTYRREGNLELAVASYRRYLLVSTEDDQARRQLARETIEVLEEALDRRAADEEAERERKERAAREREAKAARLRAERAAQERAARAATLRRSDPTDTPEEAATPSTMTFERVDRPSRSAWKPRLRTTGTVLAVVGGLSLGLAAIDAFRAHEAESSLNGATSWGNAEAQLFRDGDAARRRALITGSVGLGLTGAGLVLYLLGRESSTERGDLAIAPSLSEGSAGAIVRGSF